jgi:multidrug efflux pump subunit AcrB
MTLSDTSIKNPVFAWMLMIGLIAFGWIGFHRMGISQLPDVDFPVVTVTVTWENAAPEIMETQVSDVIEDAVTSVEGIRTITSTSQLGQATITIEFNLSRNIDAAVQDVQSHIAQAQRNLPPQIDPPIIQKVNPEDQPIMWLALTTKPGSASSLLDLCRYVNEHLKDDVAMTPGVGNIFLGGYVDPNLRIWLDAEKMAKREITVEDVLDGITTEHADVPSGYIDNGPKELNVRVYGEAYSPEEFSKLIIPNRVRGGARYRVFHFGDIATVEDGLADVRRISRLGNHEVGSQRAVGLGIIKQRGTNAVQVADNVKKRIKEIQPLLPKGMDLQLVSVFDTTEFIKDSVKELDDQLIRSVILTSLVCFLFLGSWSATLNVLLAIPTSIMGTFIALYFCGFTINSFTMLGLSMVIGIIVDDAIMVLENITRHREEGETKVHAALVGAREITSAAMAASIAILAIFAPIVFMQGIVGKFFFQFGVTISVAVMISLLEALTIAPMRCSQFLEVGRTNRLTRFVDRLMDGLRERYERLLAWILTKSDKQPGALGKIYSFVSAALVWLLMMAVIVLAAPLIIRTIGGWISAKPLPVLWIAVISGIVYAVVAVWLYAKGSHPVRGLLNTYGRIYDRMLDRSIFVLYISLVVFIGSLFLIGGIKKEFIPSQDQNRFLITITNPLGVSIDYTDSLSKNELEPWLLKQDWLNQFYVAVGGFQGGAVNTENIFVTLKHKADRPRVGKDHHAITQSEVMAEVRKQFSQVKGLQRVSILDFSQAGFSAQRGYPVQFMVQGPDWDKLAEYSYKIMDEMKASNRVTDVDTDYKPGMPEIRVLPDRTKANARGVTSLSIGNTINAMMGGLKAGKYTGRGKRYDVRVRLAEADRARPEDLSKIWVRNNYGEVVKLTDVVSYETKPALFAVTRYNRQRSISIFANPAKGTSQDEALKLCHEIAQKVLPSGYNIVESGNAQIFRESNENLKLVLLLGIFVAYMVLATQYNSFIHPVTILLALPFSATGAFLALRLTGQSLNVYSMIGLILLMGIVKKNSILLVDFTNERRKAGRNLREALLEACPVRLRPILMTSAATIAGAIPEALAKGAGSELMVPMAVTIIGGVLLSTLLTLFVVPSFYEVMAHFESHVHDAELKEALTELGELPATGRAASH